MFRAAPLYLICRLAGRFQAGRGVFPIANFSPLCLALVVVAIVTANKQGFSQDIYSPRGLNFKRSRQPDRFDPFADADAARKLPVKGTEARIVLDEDLARLEPQGSDLVSNSGSLDLGGIFSPDLDRNLEAPKPAASREPGQSAPARYPLGARSQYSWMDLNPIDRPEDLFLPSRPRESLHALPEELDPFELRIEYDQRPSYMPPVGYQPIFNHAPLAISQRKQALLDLLEVEFYRQVRRLLKRNLKSQFHLAPEMTNGFYQDRLSQINQIGKGQEEFDEFNVEYYSNEVRNSALRHEGLEGEREITLIEWGPLRIDDRGSIDFDVRSMFEADPDADRSFKIGPGLGENTKKKASRKSDSLFSGKHYRINTSLKLNFNPFRALRRNDVWETVNSYGMAVEVDFLTDILKRKIFSTETEVEVDRNGEVAVFFNIVIKERR